MKLSVVMPAQDEKGSIAAVLESVAADLLGRRAGDLHEPPRDPDSAWY